MTTGGDGARALEATQAKGIAGDVRESLPAMSGAGGVESTGWHALPRIEIEMNGEEPLLVAGETDFEGHLSGDMLSRETDLDGSTLHFERCDHE